MGEVNGEAVESVRNDRAGGASGLVVGPEHEVIDEELRAPLEKVGQRGFAFSCFELVFLVHPDPGQFLALLRQFVAAPG
jgi:hypothetical protein